jgi:hypothetical protein
MDETEEIRAPADALEKTRKAIDRSGLILVHTRRDGDDVVFTVRRRDEPEMEIR